MESVKEENLLTITQAAERAGMSESGLRNAMQRGKVKVQERFGRQVIALEDLDAYRATVKMGRPRKGSEPGTAQ